MAHTGKRAHRLRRARSEKRLKQFGHPTTQDSFDDNAPVDWCV
jgi:hypothetical protein